MSKFCKLLKESVADEAKAFPDYTKLMGAAEGFGVSEADASKLGNIRFDEKRHHAIVRNMEKKYCLRRR